MAEAADRAYKAHGPGGEAAVHGRGARRGQRRSPRRDTVIVSIAAGVRLATLEAAFPAGQAIVRAMPNTPAQVGMGMTVAVPNATSREAERAVVERCSRRSASSPGSRTKALIDAVTAVSGSGPAYVFLLAECLAEAARKAACPADLADAPGAADGGGRRRAARRKPAARRRRSARTSPRPDGTTAAALSVLMADDGLQPLMTRAVEAARKRSVELG